VDLDQVETFLALSEELHFGRTAQRVHLSQPRVSRLIAALEREVGGTLFERTSRRVRLTPLGIELRAGLKPGYTSLQQALADAKTRARSEAGTLRIGYTATTAVDALAELLKRFVDTYPHCEVVQTEVPVVDPLTPLRRHDIDVLVNWLAVDGKDLTLGPAIGRHNRMLAVSVTDPFARMESVSIEDVADREVARGDDWTDVVNDLIVPPTTPSGRTIRRTVEAHTITEVLMHVAAGRVVHPTVDVLAAQFPRRDIAYVPIRDLPAIDLGLIWLTANDNPRIRALSSLASGPPRSQLAT
jgi:DNA-binding transcriptional LysR family regulator